MYAPLHASPELRCCLLFFGEVPEPRGACSMVHECVCEFISLPLGFSGLAAALRMAHPRVVACRSCDESTLPVGVAGKPPPTHTEAGGGGRSTVPKQEPSLVEGDSPGTAGDDFTSARTLRDAIGGPAVSVELHEVDVQGFRCFGNERVTFSFRDVPGVVAVTGRNEADSKVDTGASKR